MYLRPFDAKNKLNKYPFARKIINAEISQSNYAQKRLKSRISFPDYKSSFL